MAGQRFTKRNRGSDNAKARRRRQLIGLGAAAGTFLAAALTPVAANAGPILNRVSGLVHLSPIVGPASGGDGAGGHGGQAVTAGQAAKVGTAARVGQAAPAVSPARAVRAAPAARPDPAEPPACPGSTALPAKVGCVRPERRIHQAAIRHELRQVGDDAAAGLRALAP
jgi:hypothetical protein